MVARAVLAVVVLLRGSTGAIASPDGPISAELRARMDARPAAVHKAWVYFRDKGAAAGAPALSDRARARRALRGDTGIRAERDAPLDGLYVAAVEARVRRLRNVVRWLNAVSVEARAQDLEAVAALPFVTRVDLVRGYRRRPGDEETLRTRASDLPALAAPEPVGHALDYGASLSQLEQLGVPDVHDLGLHGEGVVIAVLDAGFSNLAHESLAPARILARRDFVNGDEDVGDGADRGEGSHGTETLSVLGGFRPGQLIGPAFGADFILAKTEDTESETPVEEDNWAAAAEWVEALGADVVSTSLGYLRFDAPYSSYTAADMDGATTITTLAAAELAARGVVVVASAGNAGFSPVENTLGAPADGRRVLAAGAVDWLGDRAPFSSVGPTADGRIKPDVAARGVLVKVASPASATDYVFVNGTSFSCPLVAGAVALVLQAHPSYTVGRVRTVLRATASQAAAPDNLLGYGIVNVRAAIDAPPPRP